MVQFKAHVVQCFLLGRPDEAQRKELMGLAIDFWRAARFGRVDAREAYAGSLVAIDFHGSLVRDSRFACLAEHRLVLDDLNRGIRRHPVEQVDDIGVAHADAAVRSGHAHPCFIRATVNIDVATHGIDATQPIALRLAT